ncbi:MAG: hypothetical protein GIKADHBN_01593 [Phycisphaerales bacterium]|nr:hypothetical protein [Phycisphaerales bacterium]
MTRIAPGYVGSRPWRALFDLQLAAQLAALLPAWLAHAAPPVNPLDVGAGPAEKVIVSSSIPDDPSAIPEDSPMLAKLAGVMVVLKGPEARLLRSAGPGTPPEDLVDSAERVAYLTLVARDRRKTVELAQTQSGSWIVFELDPSNQRSRASKVKPEVMGQLVAGWNHYAGGFEPLPPDHEPAIGRTERLAGPYVPGWFTLDKEMLGERLLNGGRTAVEGVTRVLATQEIFVRLPRGYTPRRPAGVLVWIDPTETGQIPAAYHDSLDELYLVAVGAAGMGNSHPMADRLQLAFDGLATVARRFHVDPSRVFVTGVSGGGRLASIMVGCFPDIFAGGVPVVGVSCYQNLPTGVGGFWAGGFRRPPAKLFAQFKKRPLAVITGGRDFNRVEIERAVEVFERDGCNVRLFAWDDLGHEVPSAARLNEAMVWMDPPEAREQAAQGAEQDVAAFGEALAAGKLDPAAARKELARITRQWPWSDAAWKAIELAGSR